MEFVTGLVGQMDHYEDLRLCYDGYYGTMSILSKANRIVGLFGENTTNAIYDGLETENSLIQDLPYYFKHTTTIDCSPLLKDLLTLANMTKILSDGSQQSKIFGIIEKSRSLIDPVRA